MSNRRPSPDAPDTTLIGSLRRCATRTAGPVLLCWLVASVAEFLLLEFIGLNDALTGWALGLDGPPFSLFLAAAALPFITAFRDALYRPARASFAGRDPGLMETARSAVSVIFPVLGAQFTLALAQIGVLWLCQAIGAPFPTFVVLPITFALTPTLYFAATRGIGGIQAARRALELWRRHWLVISVAHGTALLVVLAMTDQPMGPAELGSLRDLSAHLTRGYLSWLLLCSTYLHLDTKHG